MGIDWAIQCFDILGSTQSYIKTQDLKEGLVVRALRQELGIGRHGRSWEEGEGNLYFSFTIQPYCELRYAGQLSILTSVALYETLSQYVGSDALQLKWPNDILLHDKKCSGILIDIEDVVDDQIKSVIIGIGVNIGTAPLDISACLQDYHDAKICTDTMLNQFLARFSDLYENWKSDGIDRIHSKYCEYHIPNKVITSVKIGTKVISGLCDGIDLFGNLRLIDDHDGSLKTITSGEVFYNNQG